MPRKRWLGLKWRAVVSTGAVAFVMLGTLLFHGHKQLDKLDEQHSIQERQVIIQTIRVLLDTWNASNERFLYVKKAELFNDYPYKSEKQIKYDLETLVISSEFGYEIVSAAFWINGNCWSYSQEGWSTAHLCGKAEREHIYCTTGGCCKIYGASDSIKGTMLQACYDLAAAFVNQKGASIPSIRIITGKHATTGNSLLIGKELGFPEGAGIELLNRPPLNENIRRNILTEFLILGSVAVIGALTVLFASLYVRLAKIRHILTGMNQVIAGDATGFGKSLNATMSKGFVDEIDMIASKLRELFYRINELREKEISGAAEKTRRELAEAYANERALLLNQMAKASEEEKASIARELHDEVGQAVVSIRVDASIIARSCIACERQPAVVERAKHIGETCEKLGKSIHYVIDDLRPPAIDTHGLKESIHALVREWRVRLKGHTAFELTTHDKLDGLALSMQSTIYRIVQESLTNIAKHASAKHVSIKVDLGKVDGVNMVLIDILDDGKGFEVSRKTTGRGLDGMRERVMANGGAFEIATSPKNGVHIHCMLPLMQTDQRSKSA